MSKMMLKFGATRRVAELVMRRSTAFSPFLEVLVRRHVIVALRATSGVMFSNVWITLVLFFTLYL